MIARERTALITGGGRGVGRGIALALAADGFTVAVAARSADELEETVRLAGPRARSLVCDLADRTDCRALAGRTRAALGDAPDVLVHAAGITGVGDLDGLEEDVWDRTQQVNVTAAYLLAKDLVPAMRERGWGRVITVGSLYSRFAARGTAAYATSKHALLGLTRAIAAEYASSGVTANTLVPGWVDTEMVRVEVDRVATERGSSPDEVRRHFLRNQPIRRLITPAEVGALAAYLCSDAAAMITGQGIDIDGGSYQG